MPQPLVPLRRDCDVADVHATLLSPNSSHAVRVQLGAKLPVCVALEIGADQEFAAPRETEREVCMVVGAEGVHGIDVVEGFEGGVCWYRLDHGRLSIGMRLLI